MKTQCPRCKSVHEIPPEYRGTEIKCTTCKESFPAVKFESPVIPRPQRPDSESKPKPPAEPIKCPQCGSTQITGTKKGYSGGKAVSGALLLGPLGLLAGLHGSKKIMVTCLNCGHQWEAGQK